MTDDTADDRAIDRQDRMSERFERGDPDDGDSTGVGTDTDTETTTVRETVGRTFFIGEELLEEIDNRFKQYDAQYHTEHGEELSKNKEFYPELFRAIDWDQVEANLGIANEDDQ